MDELLMNRGAMARQVFDVESFGDSNVGCVRELNEDRFLVVPEAGLFVVADGMGGHDAGEIASTAIIEHLRTIGVPSSALDLRARFEDRMTLANSEIRGVSMSRDGITIGSTVAALLAYDRDYACIWSGDSRVYMIRDGQLYQVSRDHTEVQDLIDRGLLTRDEAATWPRRNVITRAIGVMDAPPLEIAHGQLQTDDKFLICSDGLTGHVSDMEIRDILASAPPKEGVEQLIALALDRGGTDNVTVIIVHFRGGPTTLVVDLWKH